MARWRLAVLLAALLVAGGCRLHLSQVTSNRPVSSELYHAIELGSDGRREVLARLGPPDTVVYTPKELVFDYASVRHRGTEARLFLPTDILPGFNPLFLISVLRFFFDDSGEPDELQPTAVERTARIGASAAASLVPFASGEDILILRGYQLRGDQLRVVFDRETLTTRRKSLRLATGEYAEESFTNRVLLQTD